MKPILFIAFIALGPALADQLGPRPLAAYASTDLPTVTTSAATAVAVSQDQPTTRVNDAALCGR